MEFGPEELIFMLISEVLLEVRQEKRGEKEEHSKQEMVIKRSMMSEEVYLVQSAERSVLQV